MLHKNPGFVIIDIEEHMGLSEKQNEHIKKVINSIYNRQSIFTIIYNYIYYYLLRYFHFFHFFKINNLFFNSKSVNNLSFYIFDHGVQFYGKNINFLIPYDYIIEFGNVSGSIILRVFANFTDENKIQFSDKISVILFSANSPKIMKTMKLNMEYHILYNKLNTAALCYLIKPKMV